MRARRHEGASCLSDIVGNIDIVDDKKARALALCKTGRRPHQKVLFALNNSAEMKPCDVLYKKMTGSYDQFLLYAKYHDVYIELIKKSCCIILKSNWRKRKYISY